MSDEVDKIASTVEDLGRKVLAVLERSANNPPLLGIELVSLGSFVKLIPQIDFVVWDFSGAKVPPPNVQTAQKQAAATGTAVPDWVKPILGYVSTIVGVFESTPQGQIGEAILGNTAGGALDPNKALASVGSPVPNIFGLLGINLPTQITISEVLILGGILLLAEPLLKSVTGGLGSLFSTAAKGIALG